MIKLYRWENNKVVAYHEAWVRESTITEHWGWLGETGESREHARKREMGEEENVKQILAQALAEGYERIEIDDHSILLIEYRVDGFGSSEDLDKRYALEEQMNETLGWRGLGHCDGGSIGSGTMEVCCFVVDFETARRVIVEDLAGTPFSDYSRIFEEGTA